MIFRGWGGGGGPTPNPTLDPHMYSYLLHRICLILVRNIYHEYSISSLLYFKPLLVSTEILQMWLSEALTVSTSLFLSRLYH